MKKLGALIVLYVLTTAVVRAVDAPDSSSPGGTTCEVGDMRNRFVLSPEKFAITRALFKALCVKSAGNLVNGEDTRLWGRLEHPKTPGRLNEGYFYPPDAVMQRIEGAAIVAYILETDGHVSWVSVLTSTGNSELDAAAYWRIRKSSFKVPEMLDGKPVRVYLVHIVKFKVY